MRYLLVRSLKEDTPSPKVCNLQIKRFRPRVGLRVCTFCCTVGVLEEGEGCEGGARDEAASGGDLPAVFQKNDGSTVALQVNER